MLDDIGTGIADQATEEQENEKAEKPIKTVRQEMARRAKLVKEQKTMQKWYNLVGRKLSVIGAEIKAIDNAVVN
jgi:hypothetical protein